jgi:uncharacterized glyoxalase superfamily protein PhnB
MSKARNPIPEGFRTVTPHLSVNGAAEYIDFLKRAFGAVELERSAVPDGRLMHAEVRIGDCILMLNDDFPEYCAGAPLAKGRLPVALNLYVPNADEMWARAVAAGCEVVTPLADQFWGDRYGQVKDPFGFTWSIATHVEDLTSDEIKQREAAAFPA